ncbi:RHS repeat-associated core domain-containing protein [Chryseobacterium camelliae]|uniref:RHS repeat domain-containing protein n=1 Tax=Chryseobacterium camelliae TaxID=1265445 RepID=UPI002FDCED03
MSIYSAEVLEENNYYPFGLKHQGYNPTNGNPSYKYQYSGKELQQETGWNDFGARMYMSDIARWGVIDPLAETTTRVTPYNYALNNPVMFIDPDGRRAVYMGPEHDLFGVENIGERSVNNYKIIK